MYHVPRVRQADPIFATMGFDDRPCLIIGYVTSPDSVQFQQHLNPGGDSRACRLHPPLGEVMACGSQPAAGVAYYINFKSLG
jgi:hypothetical protein